MWKVTLHDYEKKDIIFLYYIEHESIKNISSQYRVKENIIRKIIHNNKRKYNRDTDIL